MLTLDCESRDSARASVALAYGISEDELDGFLRQVNLEDHFKRARRLRDGRGELVALFGEAFSGGAGELSRVAWFHLTRVAPGVDFREGILPLPLARERVWETMFGVFDGTADGERLRDLRAQGVGDFQYALKKNDPIHAGPFAMLVRDSAFRAQEMHNHDYLGIPETMEDVCNGYRERHGVDLAPRLGAALEPTIVKFWSSERTDEGCLEAAIYYLYLSLHGEELCIEANTCFDGGGQTIPRADIERVERPRGEHSHG